MGFFGNLMDGEAKAVRKASRSMDTADKYCESKEIDKARSELAKAKEALDGVDPRSSTNKDELRNAVSRLSDAYLKLGINATAMDVLDHFIKALPDDRRGTLLKVAAHRRLNEKEKALGVLDELVSRKPMDREAHLMRREVLAELGRNDEAMKALMKALEADPLHEETYDLILQVTDDKPLWMGRKASALIHQDRAESALYELENALKLAPRDLMLTTIMVEALEKLGREDEAADLLGDVLARDKDNAMANLMMARRTRKKGSPTVALDHYKRLLHASPQDPTGWSEVASLLFEMGRFDESQRSYERLHEVDPDDLDALYGQCRAFAAMKNKDGFLKTAKVLLETIKNDPAAHLFVADTLVSLGAEDEALRSLQGSQELFPNNMDLLDRRRAILTRQKKYVEVVALCEAQMGIKVEHLPVFQDLGQAQIALGKIPEAVKVMERGIKIWPDDPLLLELLRECYKRNEKDKDVIEYSDRLLRIKPHDKLALFDKAVALDRLGRKEEAVMIYSDVLMQDPNDVEASKRMSIALFTLGKHEEALARAAQGALHDPDQLVFWRIEGDSLFLLKRFDEAVKAYERAISLAPQDKKLIYQKGLCLESLRRFEEAIVCYDQAILLDPKDKNVWISKGIALEWLERYEEALACYDQALSLDKEGKFVHARRGQVLAKLTRHEEAVVSFDKALDLGPKDLEVLVAKKSSLKSLGRNDETIKVCDKIVKLDPKNKAAWVDRGAAQFRLNEYPEAIRSFDRALEIEPNDMQVLQLKRTSVVAKGDADETLKVCEEMLRIDPRNKTALIDKANALEKLNRLEEALSAFSALIMMDDSDALMHKGKGRVLMSLGKYGEAAEAYDIAFTLNHDPDSLFNKGRSLLLMRNYEMALSAFEQCISLNSTVAHYHSDCGRALASLNRLDEAVKSFDKALGIDRSDAQTWKYKGNALYRLGEMENAMLCLNRALDLGAEEFGIYKMRGKVLEDLGRHEDAMDSYQKAYALDHNDGAVLESMGMLHDKMGDPQKGLEMLDKALTINPRNRHGWMERADIAERLNRDDEVLRCYDNAIGLDPNDPAAWNGKGMALLRLNRYDQAKRAFEKALELSPNMASATEGLRLADGKARERTVAEMTGKVLEFQFRNGRRMSKEEVFRECNVPYQMLDEVFGFIDQREYVDPSQLPEDEFANLEAESRTALLSYYRSARTGQGGMTLADVYASMPDRNVLRAKRVMGYIEGVNDIDFTYLMPDKDTEEYLRKALAMPEEKRNLFYLMESLNIGVYKARNIIAIMGSLKAGERPVPSPRSKGQRTTPTARSSDDLFVEQPKKKQPKTDAVFLPDDRPKSSDRAERDNVRLFGQEERELYDTFYPPKPEKKKEKVDDMEGRRCLFHGGLAISACPKCSSMLCKECVASGKCPRCGFVLGEKAPRKDEGPVQDRQAAEPEERDWSRL